MALQVKIHSWILVLTQLTAINAAKEPTCLYPEDYVIREHMCINIKCKRAGYVIADLQLASGISNEPAGPNNDPTCMGETMEFIDESFDCYWRPSCTVYFPLSKMITSRVGKLESFITKTAGWRINGTCFNADATFACLIQAKCVKESDIIDIPTYGRLNQPTPIKKRKGIFRSHKNYPWHYDLSSLNDTSELEIKMKLENKKKKVLNMEFYDLDIHDDSEITLKTNVRQVKVSSMALNISNLVDDSVLVQNIGDIFSFADEEKNLSIKFKFNKELFSRREETSYRGFVICFKRYNRKITRKRKSEKKVCERVLEQATVTAVSPYSDACTDSLEDPRKRYTNCCCDITDKGKCETAIKHAKLRNCILNDQDCHLIV